MASAIISAANENYASEQDFLLAKAKEMLEMEFPKDRLDPVVALWEQMTAKDKEANALSNIGYDKLKAFTPDHDIVFDPCITCHFPEYEGLPTHGMSKEEPRIVYGVGGVKSAIMTLRARASYYGEKEKQEAEKLGVQWLDEIKEVEAKAEAIAKESGYADYNKKSNAAYAESCEIRNKFFQTKAETLEGILLQIKEMYQYIHYGMQNHGEGIKKQLEIVTDGLEEMVSRAA
jgi:hypothetical protein